MNAPASRLFVLKHPDGLSVSGNVHAPPDGGPAPAVVICHGFKGFKEWGFFPYLADRLAASGLAAIRFDFALNGIGPDGVTFSRLDLFARNTLSQELADLDLVLRAARGGALPAGDRIDAARVGLLGHSRGGGIVLIRAVEDRAVGAVATWAAVRDFPSVLPVDPAEWKRRGVIEIPNVRTGQMMPVNYAAWEDYAANRERYDFLPRLRGLACPALFVHAEGDAVVPASAAGALAAAAGPRGRARVVSGGDHTFGASFPFAGTNPVLEEAVAATVAFFKEVL